MSKAKPSSLSSALVTKGAAKPVVDVDARTTPSGVTTPEAPPIAVAPPVASETVRVETPVKRTSSGTVPMKAPPITAGPTKSMTVKIDESTYKKLKLYGVETGKSSQDIFVEALAGYFKAHQIL